MFEKLFGDGIHDDTKAIQELIDSGIHELCLPDPKVCYLISAPLELPSNFKLKLPRFAEVKLAKDSNCIMLKNKTLEKQSNRAKLPLWDHLNRWSEDYPCENIEVEGGIWNLNNLEQKPNPLLTDIFDPKEYNGFIFLFYNVKNLRLSSLTLKDPVTFAVTLDTISYFTIDNIIFDFNYGNPLATNMDGIHMDGNCHFGNITNLKGACYDDLIALNADEGTGGSISNIKISGIYAEDCHSAVRMLSAGSPVTNIHISDVYGTYFQYCIGLTKYYQSGKTGYYDAITLDNIYASKAPWIPEYHKGEGDEYRKDPYIYSPIWIEWDLYIKSLKISNMHRAEYVNPVSTIFVGHDTVIDRLMLDNISTDNHTDAQEIPLLVNEGQIKYFDAINLFSDGEELTEV